MKDKPMIRLLDLGGEASFKGKYHPVLGQTHKHGISGNAGSRDGRRKGAKRKGHRK